jgi:hypothetical protein
MKPISYLKMSLATGSAITAALFITGCASSSNSSNPTTGSASSTALAKTDGPQAPALPANVTLHKDKDIQGVWLAPGFNFKGYEALFVEPTKYNAEVRNNETKEREATIRDVQLAIVSAAQAIGVFPIVTAGSPTTTGKALRLQNTIIKFEKGGGAARYWAGLYGAGQPHVRVHGEVFDADKLVCVYEVERSGEGGGARMFGGFMSDDNILGNDIRDLASDLADFFKRTSAK